MTTPMNETETIYMNAQGIIVGGPNNSQFSNDKLNGTAGADIIVGTNCKDAISGRNGNDTMTGGIGADKFRGAAGLSLPPWGEVSR